MHFRLITGGATALLLLAGTAVMARELPAASRAPHALTAFNSASGLFGLFGKKDRGAEEAPVMLAQADPRITQLEEEIRKLSGTVEELNFQVLQMQEQLRKMQEDNEFRFQELEKGGTAGTGTNQKSEVPPSTGDPATGTQGSGETTAKVEQPPEVGPQDSGVPGVNLGTITVDKDGNVVSSGTDQPMDGVGGGQSNSSSDGTTVAALPTSDDPDELYRNAYEFMLSGDYPTAETGFRDHIARFPADPKGADAHYWLGEALLSQQKYRDAAEVFLAANRDYPDAAKAPDMLLKLGVSLKELNQREVACATFNEVSKRYPNASKALNQRVKQEQALAAC